MRMKGWSLWQCRVGYFSNSGPCLVKPAPVKQHFLWVWRYLWCVFDTSSWLPQELNISFLIFCEQFSGSPIPVKKTAPTRGTRLWTRNKAITAHGSVCQAYAPLMLALQTLISACLSSAYQVLKRHRKPEESGSFSLSWHWTTSLLCKTSQCLQSSTVKQSKLLSVSHMGTILMPCKVFGDLPRYLRCGPQVFSPLGELMFSPKPFFVFSDFFLVCLFVFSGWLIRF